ncbi:hypothetical protein [Pseudoalteromonas 'SMAR']|uniref:hypothetical protein n=1 Tax=Pseudoalteromonas 'SMAR' TaxID=3416908 RepID=UPI003AF23815
MKWTVAINLTAVESVPSTLTAGKTDLQYQVDDTNNEAYFEISGNTNNSNVSCDYTVPVRAKVSADACGVFPEQALAKGKLSERDYNYLTETVQVPLFSASDGELVGYYSCALYSE